MYLISYKTKRGTRKYRFSTETPMVSVWQTIGCKKFALSWQMEKWSALHPTWECKSGSIKIDHFCKVGLALKNGKPVVVPLWMDGMTYATKK